MRCGTDQFLDEVASEVQGAESTQEGYGGRKVLDEVLSKLQGLQTGQTETTSRTILTYSVTLKYLFILLFISFHSSNMNSN